jgi:trk system potassium uptake protein TrkH
MLRVFLFLLTVPLSWIPFRAFGYDALDVLFEVVTATAGTRLVSGVSSPGLTDAFERLCLDPGLNDIVIPARTSRRLPRLGSAQENAGIK